MPLCTFVSCLVLLRLHRRRCRQLNIKQLGIISKRAVCSPLSSPHSLSSLRFSWRVLAVWMKLCTCTPYWPCNATLLQPHADMEMAHRLHGASQLCLRLASLRFTSRLGDMNAHLLCTTCISTIVQCTTHARRQRHSPSTNCKPRRDRNPAVGRDSSTRGSAPGAQHP